MACIALRWGWEVVSSMSVRSSQWTPKTSKHLEHLSAAAAVDPSAAPPSLFRLAGTNSGWRALQNSAGSGAKLFRRRNSAHVHKRRPKHPLSA